MWCGVMFVLHILPTFGPSLDVEKSVHGGVYGVLVLREISIIKCFQPWIAGPVLVQIKTSEAPSYKMRETAYMGS